MEGGRAAVVVVFQEAAAAPAVAARPLGQDIPLDVVYEDKDLIVIEKPAGLVVHPAAGNPDGTLVNALIAHCGAELIGIGGEARPGIVHRLDKDTSGLLVAAKTERAMASPRRCPICKRVLPQGEAGETYRPFCSRRCADVDLARWLTGSYAIPGEPDESEDEQDGSTPKHEPPLGH